MPSQKAPRGDWKVSGCNVTTSQHDHPKLRVLFRGRPYTLGYTSLQTDAGRASPVHPNQVQDLMQVQATMLNK